MNSKLCHDVSPGFEWKKMGNVKNILEDRNKVIST